MAANRTIHILGSALAVWMAAGALMASEHRGTVQSGGVALPGVTVTATRDDKKVSTTTDDSGAYLFPNLEDGVWTLRFEMLGFGGITKEIGVEPDAPAAQFEMKLLSAAEIKAAVAAALAPPAAVAPTPAPAATPAAADIKAPAAAPAATAATPAPTPAEAAKPAAVAANPQPATGRGGRGQQNGGRPSLTQAVNGYQRMNVNATGDAGSSAESGAADMNGAPGRQCQ